MQVLREVYNKMLVEDKGEFFLIESGFRSLPIDQETKNEYLNFSNVEFSIKVQENVARAIAFDMIKFF